MAAILNFDTEEVRLSSDPEAQTSKVVGFPLTYVAPPRLPIGLSALDLQMGTDLHVVAYNDAIDEQQFTTHVDTWGNTTLFSAETNILVLKPANIDFLSGEFQYLPTQQSQRITFEHPFVTTPQVSTFLRSFNFTGGSSTRVKTYTSDIDPTGFTINIGSWQDGTLNSAIAGWVAYPSDRDNIYSGTANTLDIRPWQDAQAQTSQAINFHGFTFQEEPTVFVALNYIDVSTQADLRIKTYVDNITTSGLTWHIDSWGDTLLWTGGISYIALGS